MHLLLVRILKKMGNGKMNLMRQKSPVLLHWSEEQDEEITIVREIWWSLEFE